MCCPAQPRLPGYCSLPSRACNALTPSPCHPNLQEWNEIQYNGVYWEPPQGPGKPGVLEEGKSYTFKYPRPPR